jgi:hypothetical protein
MYAKLSIILRKTRKLWKIGFKGNVKTSKMVEVGEYKKFHIEGLQKF